MLILALLAAAPVSQADPEKLYGDWVVACDNLQRCEMTSLFPSDESGPADDTAYEATMSVSRDAGPAGALTVEVWPASTLKGKASLKIDDAVIATGIMSDESLTFRGADAIRIATAMSNGKQLALIDGGGKTVARISLAGSSASLRHIDASQGRVGTVTALVAKGAKPASTVPAAKAPPQIIGVRPSGTPAIVSKAMRAAMDKQGECQDAYDSADSMPEVETFALGGGKTLALLPCGAGAYNYSSVAFIIAGGKAEPAAFEGGDGDLVNAGFGNGLLSSHNKGRGIGDCGAAETYVWDGKRFRLVEASVMSECRGSTNWLTIFRATPVFR
jgi:hypothetical protein